MSLKFELVWFYNIHKTDKEMGTEKLINLTGLSVLKIEELLKKCEIVDRIVERNELANNENAPYFDAIQILFPHFVTFKDIVGSEIGCRLAEKKLVLASETTETSLSDPMQMGYTLDSEIIIAEKMELNNNIRDFFILFPYSTVKEAARAIRVPVQKIREAAELLRNNGEDIKFNNTPVIMEREQITREVIKVKTEEPALTIHEISRKLGVSVSEVNIAIKNMIYVWKTEKADNYDFYLHKTSTSIDMVETEAWKQHEHGGTRPSSRWLEIALMAIEKRIAIHGLKAPDKLDITNRDVRSKEERDNIIDVAFEADVLDIDTSKIQITGS